MWAMRTIIDSLVILVLAFGVSSPAAPAKAAETIVMVFNEGAMPDYSSDATEGMFCDFLDAFSRQHPEFEIVRVNVPRKRMDMMMDSGEAQAFSLTSPIFVEPERVNNFLYTRPLWTVSDHVIMKRGNTFDYARPEDLIGKTVGVILNYSYGPLDPLIQSGHIATLPVRLTSQLYRLLLNERVDAIIGNSHIDRYQIKQKGFDPDDFVFDETPLYEWGVVTQVQKTQPAFFEALDAFIEASQRNGLLQQLEDAYLK